MDDIWDEIDDIWMISGWYFGVKLMIYTCVVICVCRYTGVYCASYILVIFGWNWDEIDDIINEIDDIINEIDDNYTSLIIRQ